MIQKQLGRVQAEKKANSEGKQLEEQLQKVPNTQVMKLDGVGENCQEVTLEAC